jgi:hypothetical protein
MSKCDRTLGKLRSSWLPSNRIGVEFGPDLPKFAGHDFTTSVVLKKL